MCSGLPELLTSLIDLLRASSTTRLDYLLRPESDSPGQLWQLAPGSEGIASCCDESQYREEYQQLNPALCDGILTSAICECKLHVTKR